MATYTIPRVEIEEVFTSATTLAPFPQAALIMGPQYKLWRYNEASEKAYTSVVHPTIPSLGNQYQPGESTTYAWPSQPNNSVVDADYTKVYFENVKAKYFPNEDLGSGTPGSLDDFEAVPTTVGGSVYHSNRLKASDSTLHLKTCSTTTRSSCFSGRDVQPGDVIEITGKIPVAGTTAMLQATITNILYTPSNVTYGLNTNVSGSPAFLDFYSKVGTNMGIGASYTGPIIFSSAGTGVTRITDEQQLVVMASNGPDVYSTGGVGAVRTNFTFNITDNTIVFGAAHSLAINDLVYFDADGHTLPTGLVEWTAYWVHSVTSTAVTLKKSPDNTSPTIDLGGSPSGAVRLYKGTPRFIGSIGIVTGGVSSLTTSYVDKEFNVTSSAYFLSTPPTNTDDDLGAILYNAGMGGGTVPTVSYSTNWPVLDTTRNNLDDYTGEKNVVYTLTVTRGGPFYNGTNSEICAQVEVSSTIGDYNVVRQVTKNSLFSVGTFGLKAQFTSGTGLMLGDKWSLSLIAGTSQIYNIIETDTNLWSTSDATFLDPAQGVTVALYLKKDYIEVPQLQPDSEVYNWTIEADAAAGITINASGPSLPVFTYDPLLLKTSTSNAQLPITTNPSEVAVLQASSTPAANVYVQYRALIKTNTTGIGSVTSTSEIEPLLGVIDPANPLAQGVYHALINAADSSPVYYIGVDSDDVAGYSAALAYASKTNTVYSLVPLTHDSLVGAAIISHVNNLSTPAKARWRIGWLAPLLAESEVLVDHFTSGTITYDYTGKITPNPVTGFCELFTVVAGASQLPLKNIRIGDTVRYNFHTNARGTLLWDEVTVTNTLTNTTCLVTALDEAVYTATRIEVVRTYTAQEQTAEFVSRIESTQDRRIRYIFPAQFKYNGAMIPSYFLAAACAGLRSGVAPHQPLTNKLITGIDQADGVSATYEWFTEEQLNTLAAAGCWIIAQNYTNDAPFVRHQLTSAYALMDTNKSEDSVTTNVDSIAYGLQRRLAPYIGKYNINPTNIALISAEINSELTARATNTFTQSAGNQLISFKINSVIQDPLAKDRIRAEILLEVPTPMNNVYVKLII